MKIKKLFILICFISFICTSWRFATKGFRPHKIFNLRNLKDSYKDIKPPEKIDKILNQKYKYLNKGSQLYVFASEDKKYVIKFISSNKYKEPFRRNILSLLPINFKNYRKTKKINRERNLKNAINSYLISYNYLKKETGTIYIHLKNRKIFKKKLTIIDNVGSSYNININSKFFIIQKKAEKLKPKILKIIKDKNKEELKKIVLDYFNLSFSIVKKGFINKDSSIKNIGYIDEELIEMDLGRFVKIKSPNFYENLKKYTFLNKKFFEKNSPDIIKFFEKNLKNYENKIY
ncbi:MAG: hypothetical protein AMS24_01385 [Chlamydiae bacterium SM23_39]|nr:MAG: hypothetical protein AMS24_01385 [Chlamydiae bacterium SM23_39]